MTDLVYTLQDGSQLTFAWFWLIPIAIAALTTVIAIANSDSTSTTKLVGKSLGILGMQEAGKTQILRNFQGKPYRQYEATSTEDYSEFETKIGDRTIKFQQGRDIGGGDMYIRDYYEDFIKNKDIILFVFDVYRYLRNSDYAKDVRARLDFIYDKLNRKKADGVNDELWSILLNKKYMTIGSHMDKLSESEQKSAISSLQASVKAKPYSPMFHNNLLLCDLTKRDDFLKLLSEKKIF